MIRRFDASTLELFNDFVGGRGPVRRWAIYRMLKEMTNPQLPF
jgi:hypothetical protein